MVIKRETLEDLEKGSIISILMHLTTSQFLDQQKAYENEMLVEYLLSSSSSLHSASTAVADDRDRIIIQQHRQTVSSSETRSGRILQQGGGAPEPTLNQQLLLEFEVLDAKKSDLNRQKERVVSHSIGMKSKLPQVIRREEKKRKIEDPSKPDLINKKLIEEEGKSDLDLFKEIDSLTSCCSRSDGTTNCIKKHFSIRAAGSNSLRFDFTALCSFVRRCCLE